MFQSRDEFGGANRSLVRRIFGDGENPLTWAIPIGTYWRIAVRLHLVFALYIVLRLAFSFSEDSIGFGYTAMALGSLFVLILLHEFGHCFGCRAVGGEADEILMWPLGGLAMCLPPDHWRAHLWTVIAGPAVNAGLFPLFGLALYLITDSWAAVLFNPFDVNGALQAAVLSDGTQPWWLVLLWWLHFSNLALLAFNVLVPMYPMDGGRILHALLWAKIGRYRATEIAVIVGFVAAAAMFLAAMLGQNTMLMALAMFGGISCWMERQRNRMEGEFAGAAGGLDLSAAYASSEEDPGPTKRQQRAEGKARAKAEAERAEIDRILQKISTEGMGALTKAERRTLERASQD